MSGNAPPSTPRRGEGKKKNRATEDMEDDADDKEIQDTLDAIRKAEAAAKQTMLEMGINGGKETDPNNKNGMVPTQSKELSTTHLDPQNEPEIRTRQEKVLPKETQRAANTSNSSRRRIPKRKAKQRKKARKKIRKRENPPKRSKSKKTKPHRPSWT